MIGQTVTSSGWSYLIAKLREEERLLQNAMRPKMADAELNARSREWLAFREAVNKLEEIAESYAEYERRATESVLGT